VIPFQGCDKCRKPEASGQQETTLEGDKGPQEKNRFHKNASSEKCVPGSVECVDPQDEEVAVTEAVCLPLHGLDLIIGSFERRGGDGIVIPGQETVSVEPKGFRKIFEDADAGRFSPCNPVVKMSLCGDSVRLLPQKPEIFLHVVGRGQGFV